MTIYAQHMTARQTEKARPDQVQNNAGGFVFQLDIWAQLQRWLVLGSEGGTFYVAERKLTRDNAQTIAACLATDGPRTVRAIVEISQAGRAPKNDPAIFALAMAAGAEDPATRKAALDALPLVCRTGTHLLHFAQSVEQFRRWGHGLRRAVAKWYADPPLDRVALQAVKYQQRDGWSHRDLLRLAHPSAKAPGQDALFRWIVAGGAAGLAARTLTNAKTGSVREQPALAVADLPRIVQGYELLRGATLADAPRLIAEFGLPHECVQNEFKHSPGVWAALLPHMGVTALLRNLGKMTSIGLLAPLSAEAGRVAETFADVQRLKQGRVHPLAILVALKTYAQGHGDKGGLSWTPVPQIVDALNEAFYLSFDAVEPTGKAHLLALDVSGSMAHGNVAGMSITPREATAAVAMVTARVEKNWHIMGFSSRFIPLDITPSMRLDDVVRKMDALPFESTDCGLPMVWAKQHKAQVDAFVVMTDNETYAGPVHPYQALRDYRQQSGRAAKLIVVGTAATEFTIADPKDGGMLDVVGFSTDVPAVMADFVRQG